MKWKEATWSEMFAFASGKTIAKEHYVEDFKKFSGRAAWAIGDNKANVVEFTDGSAVAINTNFWEGTDVTNGELHSEAYIGE
jgi:hypothetical protein